MPETAAPALDFSADADLISFLKPIPDGRYRRGVRYPKWYLLLVTVLGILSDCRSSRDLEAFAKRRREALNWASPGLVDTDQETALVSVRVATNCCS